MNFEGGPKEPIDKKKVEGAMKDWMETQEQLLDIQNPNPSAQDQKEMEEIKAVIGNFEITDEQMVEGEAYFERLRVYCHQSIEQCRKGDLIAFAPFHQGFVNMEDNSIMEKVFKIDGVTDEEIERWREGYLALPTEIREQAETEVDNTWI